MNHCDHRLQARLLTHIHPAHGWEDVHRSGSAAHWPLYLLSSYACIISGLGKLDRVLSTMGRPTLNRKMPTATTPATSATCSTDRRGIQDG